MSVDFDLNMLPWFDLLLHTTQIHVHRDHEHEGKNVKRDGSCADADILLLNTEWVAARLNGNCDDATWRGRRTWRWQQLR